MFVTSPSFETRVPINFSPGDRYWLVALLAVESPWYLLSYRAGADDELVTQTALVAWESALLKLIDEVGPARVVSLHHVLPVNTFKGMWTMREVSEVWTPSTSEDRRGPLLFAFDGHEGLYDSSSAPVDLAAGGSKLLQLLPRRA
jgi:hypothetical protein